MALTCWGADLGRSLYSWIGDHGTAVQAEIVRQTSSGKLGRGKREIDSKNVSL